MFKEFLSAITEKITDFLIENPNFFQEDDRAAILEKKLKLPSSFTQYLTEVKEKEFLADLKLTLSYTKNTKDLNIKKSKLFKALVHFLTGDLARKIDLLDNDYYLYQVSDRKKIVDKLINSESKLAQTIKNILLNQTYQQVSPLAKQNGFSCFLSPVNKILRNGNLAQQWLKKYQTSPDIPLIIAEEIQTVAQQEKMLEDKLCDALLVA